MQIDQPIRESGKWLGTAINASNGLTIYTMVCIPIWLLASVGFAYAGYFVIKNDNVANDEGSLIGLIMIIVWYVFIVFLLLGYCLKFAVQAHNEKDRREPTLWNATEQLEQRERRLLIKP